MPGLLLDTNALIWIVAGAPIAEEALFAIAEAQAERALFVSPITAWEAALAVQKPNPDRRPNLAGEDAATWFRRARRSTSARLVPIGARIALEAARVPAVYGSGDPGDCYIIATARVRGLTVVTRDGPMSALAEALPDYVGLIHSAESAAAAKARRDVGRVRPACGQPPRRPELAVSRLRLRGASRRLR